MKINHRHRFFAFIIAGLIILPSASNAEKITIVADSWCPYNCEPGSEHPGFMIELVQKAFAKHNIDIEYSILPWSRAIEETRLNKHTAIIGSAHKDAPDFIFPEIPQGWLRNSFYVKKDGKWRYSGIESLPQVSLGVIADYSYNSELDEYIEKNKNTPKFVQILSGDKALNNNVKKLLAGRIGALVEGEYVINYYLAKNGSEGLLEKAGSLALSENDNLFISFSPKEPKARIYADIITKETEAMRKSGELQKILAVYNVSDWSK